MVTSRIAGYHRKKSRLSGQFLELHVLPLAEREVGDFVAAWYREAERQTRSQQAGGRLDQDRLREARDGFAGIMARVPDHKDLGITGPRQLEERLVCGVEERDGQQ